MKLYVTLNVCTYWSDAVPNANCTATVGGAEKVSDHVRNFNTELLNNCGLLQLLSWLVSVGVFFFCQWFVCGFPHYYNRNNSTVTSEYALAFICQTQIGIVFLKLIVQLLKCDHRTSKAHVMWKPSDAMAIGIAANVRSRNVHVWFAHTLELASWIAAAERTSAHSIYLFIAIRGVVMCVDLAVFRKRAIPA